jgi:predicted ester cyclase
MVGCQDKEAMAELEAMKAQAEVEEQNKEIVLNAHKAWNDGDIEGLKTIYSPDYIWHFAGEGILSLEDLIEDVMWEEATYPDKIVSTKDLILKGDKVVSRYIIKGTHEGEREGIPAKGKKVEMEGIIIDRIENGKIVETWEVADLLSLYKQLGMELKPKEEK